MNVEMERLSAALVASGVRVAEGDPRELDGVAVPLAIEPADEGEAARALAALGEAGGAAVPVGRFTRFGLGGIPSRPCVWLRTTRLAGIVEHTPGDLTVTVRAGTPLPELQATLRGHGQWLPCAPPGDAGTVGGLIATGDWGPQRLLHGAVRDGVIGLRVLLPNGSVVRTGGKVVKNVAGYDMNKLFTGSLGSAGVIVEASFKLRPLPAAAAVGLLAFTSAADAAAAAQAIVDSDLVPSALELMSPAWGERLGLPARHFIAAGFEDVPAAVSAQLDRLRGFGGLTFEALHAEVAAQFWERWRGVHQPPATGENGGSGTPAANGELVTGLRMGHPLSAAGVLVDRASGIAVRHGCRGWFSAGAGSGASRGVLAAPTGEVTALASAIGDLRALLGEFGGWLVVERAPVELKRALPVWGPAREDFPLMRAIKQKFDPAGVLNPGRFVGGL